MREPFFIRHDLHIVGIALIILALGGLVHDAAGGERLRTVTRGRLSLSVPADWLGGEAGLLRGEDSVTRVELSQAEAPGPLVSTETSLELERAQRHGPF